MLFRVISAVGAVFVLTGAAMAGEMTRGLTITGGQNALATLKLARAPASAADNETLTLVVSLEQVRDLRGYGMTLKYDSAGYEFLEAREPKGNLLQSGSGPSPLFLTSNRTPGELNVGAVKVDGRGASGEGTLVELVFKARGTAAAGDFKVSESVLVGVDGAVDLLSRVEIGDLDPSPGQYGLNQNMPNPFNPSTAIGFQLPEAGQVHLAIYNLLGQEVRVLVNERKAAGSFTVTWDGTDALGRRLASGVYLYRIQAGRFSETRRMLLLK